MGLFKIIGLLKQIDPPPELDGESVFRRWAKATAAIMMELARAVNEHKAILAAKMFVVIVRDDDLWDQLYELLKNARQRIKLNSTEDG